MRTRLHAAIVEIIVKDNAEVKYSTVQNWYPGDEHGKGGVLNLVTKRGDLRGVNSKLSLDSGRDWLGYHLEVSFLHLAW